MSDIGDVNMMHSDGEESCYVTKAKRTRKKVVNYAPTKDDEEDDSELVDLISDDSDWSPDECSSNTKKVNQVSRKRKADEEVEGETEKKKNKKLTTNTVKKPKAVNKEKQVKATKSKAAKKVKKELSLSECHAILEMQKPSVKSKYKVENGMMMDVKSVVKQEPAISLSPHVVNQSMFQNTESVECLWRDEDVVAESAGVPKTIAKNVMTLLNQDCTVPFIARYRKEMSGHLTAEKIREIETAYESVKLVHKRVNTIMKTVSKGDVDPKIISALRHAKTLEEVEYLYAPLKPGSKRSLAERAKKLGLEPFAMNLLQGKVLLKAMNLSSITDPNIPGKSSVEEVEKGMQNIIADVIAKDMEVLDFIRNHPAKQQVHFTCKKSATAVKEAKKAFVEGKADQNFKFENYFSFDCVVRNVNSHQVLAMNRGESQKILNIKLVFPSHFKAQIISKCWGRVPNYRTLDDDAKKFFESCINDAYDRLLEPHMSRQIRSELTKKAAKESVDVFCQNLKRLLLTPPVRGKTVLGIDPGFKHGCKLAAVSAKGDVLRTDVIYLHSSKNFNDAASVAKIVDIVTTFDITIIALGNGTACRETESWLSELIHKRAFRPYDVKYCIIDESGASIYSVTKEAEAELPNMDPNVRSAVSIARRLQDPLLEYVKVEPKHLGVGMYQHDIPENMLKTALDSVVVECVSFVGVDLNVCTEQLLQKISGLSSSRAKQIIQWRDAHGCFVNRQQLLEVKGLGPKSFEQCAGFVKIFPQTSIKPSNLVVAPKENKGKGKKTITESKPNLFDTTVIHPESYEKAKQFLDELKADVSEIGQQSLLRKVQSYMRYTNTKYIAEKFQASVEQMQLIIDAFNQLMDHDIRSEFEVPLFKTGVMSLMDLKIDQELTGRVTNVTHFGAFVDVGVGQSGLIHISKMRSRKVQLGDRVTVKVLSVDVQKKRIALALL